MPGDSVQALRGTSRGLQSILSSRDTKGRQGFGRGRNHLRAELGTLSPELEVLPSRSSPRVTFQGCTRSSRGAPVFFCHVESPFPRAGGLTLQILTQGCPGLSALLWAQLSGSGLSPCALLALPSLSGSVTPQPGSQVANTTFPELFGAGFPWAGSAP